VLVLLLVVVAPALLDGRQDPGTVAVEENGVTIIEASEEIAPMRVETIVLKSEPPAKAVKPEAVTPAPAPTPAREPVASSKPKSAPQPAAVSEGWMVQLGSFSAGDNAKRFASDLQGKGFPATVTSFRSGNKTMYRVQVGPRTQRADAEKLAADLKRAGHDGIVVALK